MRQPKRQAFTSAPSTTGPSMVYALNVITTKGALSYRVITPLEFVMFMMSYNILLSRLFLNDPSVPPLDATNDA
jgi:hypothetical protein